MRENSSAPKINQCVVVTCEQCPWYTEDATPNSSKQDFLQGVADGIVILENS